MNRIICVFACVCLVVGSFPVPPIARAENVEANVADLKQQLESGLKARRPEEFAFIAKVVTMVENDALPLDLVISTFLWTRKNPKAREYPFVYFQRALRERAAKLGIEV